MDLRMGIKNMRSINIGLLCLRYAKDYKFNSQHTWGTLMTAY